MTPCYPIGIQSFSEIREGGYVYVDKTEFIHSLSASGKYYFLSRPRRFGKSLFLSTLEAFYSGRRELFDGLAINRHDHDWQPYPVLHLDLTGRFYKDTDSLTAHIEEHLRGWERLYGIPSGDAAVEERFRTVIEKAHAQTGRKVVILIDEYDKPLLDTVGDRELQNYYRAELKALYGNLKRMDSHIKFAMLTGVTKLGKLSVFSDLNNLQDISMDDAYGSICGITEDELKTYFTEGIATLSAAQGLTVEDTYAKLKEYYDGYHFSISSSDIYNPFSILNSLSKSSFGAYWYSTGTPTFIVEMIKLMHIDLRELNHLDVDINSIMDASFEPGNAYAVMYQSGYLTIKGYDKRFNTLTLGYPNREVEDGFLNQLMAVFTANRLGQTEFDVKKFVLDVESGNVDSFMVRLRSMFAQIQYDQIDLGNLERNYSNVMYLVMKLMGFYTKSELRTSAGRIDLMVGTPNFVYLFEFKIDRSAREALDQIDARNYALPFAMDGRRIIKIGANFNNSTRTIDEWLVERE